MHDGVHRPEHHLHVYEQMMGGVLYADGPTPAPAASTSKGNPAGSSASCRVPLSASPVQRCAEAHGDCRHETKEAATTSALCHPEEHHFAVRACTLSTVGPGMSTARLLCCPCLQGSSLMCSSVLNSEQFNRRSATVMTVPLHGHCLPALPNIK